jgi:hypothetical protein
VFAAISRHRLKPPLTFAWLYTADIVRRSGSVAAYRYFRHRGGSRGFDHRLHACESRPRRHCNRERPGLCRRYKGFLFDIGGHRFFSKSREVVALWDEILPDDFIERPRLSRIFYRGKFYSYPLKAFEALRNLGLLQSAACMASFALAKAFPVKNPKTFHQWVRNQFGERLFAIFFNTYSEKVWGMSCDEISADWAAQRIKG